MFSTLSRSVSLITLSLLLSPLSDFQVSARWLTEDEADIECIKGKTVYKIMKDGSWIQESETQLRALNEEGIDALACRHFTYDAARSKFEILEARISNEDEDYIVSKGDIEDKELASDKLGKSDNHQILIPFGHVDIGSVVHLKTRQTNKPIFENYFAENLDFSDYFRKQLVRNKEIHIESEIPLLFKINDPRETLEISERKNEMNQKHILDIRLKKPLLEQLIDEPDEHAYEDLSLYTSVSLSTEEDYRRIGKLEAQLYHPVLTETLPENLENIREHASTIQDEVECIDAIVTSLIKKIKYFGSWDTLMGGYAPRSLETIMKTGKGDCKEYSICLAAILNKMDGYNARVAIVQRGDVYYSINTLTSMENFNHAIVKVIAPSGKAYWVDPTNAVSMVGGIFPDIADRPVHVLDLEDPAYEHIPAIDYQRVQKIQEQFITIEGRNVQITGTFSATGEGAMPMIQGLTRTKFDPVASIKASFNIAEPISPSAEIIEPKELSYVVKPFKMAYSFGANHFMHRSTKGNSFPLYCNWVSPYIMDSQEKVGGLYVGHAPETMTRKFIFNKHSAPQEELNTLAFSIQTPWLNVTRELIDTENGVLVTEKVETLKSTISPQERKSNEFINLKNMLREYFSDVEITFSK